VNSTWLIELRVVGFVKLFLQIVRIVIKEFKGFRAAIIYTKLKSHKLCKENYFYTVVRTRPYKNQNKWPTHMAKSVGLKRIVNKM